VKKLYLSVPDMVDRIRGGEIHAGFFMSHVPSEALKSVVHDPKNRLLAIDPRRTGGLLGSAIGLTRIESGTYGAQWVEEPPVETVGTWAVLVTRDDLTVDVETITRVVFAGAAFFGISGSPQDMARDLCSLPLHSGARRYYEKEGLRPTKERVDWLKLIWRSLGVLVILVGGYRGLLSVQRDHTRKAFQSRIRAVSLDADHRHSNEDLRAIRHEISDCALLPTWKAQHLDHSRLSELEGLIHERAEEAKANLKRSILATLRGLRSKSVLDDKTRRERYASLENRVWLYLENGELDPFQHKLLLEAIRDGQRELEGQPD
jgi:hypothetical protein